MKTKKIILWILICLIIVSGIVVWKFNGFNLELQYSTRYQINISNHTSISKEDIKQIASEVLGDNKYFIQDVETFGNAVAIVSEEINDEQKAQIITKFNEKYDTKLKAKDIKTIVIPYTKVIDVIKPYIIPGIITLVVISLYSLIRFRKLGCIAVLVNTVIIPIIAELLLYSSIAITRIPFGRISIACGVGLYVIIISIVTNRLEIKKDKIVEEQQEQKERK